MKNKHRPIWADSKDAQSIVGKDLLERLARRSESEFREQMEGKWEVSKGIDMARMPDKTVAAAPCGNCGVFRIIEKGIMEKCQNCGDDETDLNEEIQIP